ncbi:hypothetical protein [Desulfatiferula olefinivorans]
MSCIFGKQRFRLPEPRNGVYIPTDHQFTLSDSYLEEWKEMMETPDIKGVPPYSYYWPWMMDFTMKDLLPELGICLKNVLHLGHEARIMPDFASIREKRNRLKNRLVDLCALSKNKIVLVTETTITDENDQILYQARDYTVVLNMKPEEMEMLQRAGNWDHEEIPFRHESFRNKESLFRDDEHAPFKAYYCMGDLAGRFGSVAGALSVTHASVFTATIFRKGKVFLQGMCTANIVIKILCDELGETLGDFRVYFTNQLPFPQRIEIRYNDSVFEVFDEANTMVAYGRRSVTNTAEASSDEQQAA